MLFLKLKMKYKTLKNNHPNPLFERGKKFSSQSGQVLLLSVLVLSGVIISTSFFVGYLMVQRLKQAVLTIDSAQAFYLADSGVEFELYKILKNNNNSFTCPRILSQDAEIDSSIEISSDSQLDDINLGLVIKSTGHIKNIGRNYDVSRSQMDFSQSISSNILCGDPTETDYNQDICILPDGGNNPVKQTISTNSRCETGFNKF